MDFSFDDVSYSTINMSQLPERFWQPVGLAVHHASAWPPRSYADFFAELKRRLPAGWVVSTERPYPKPTYYICYRNKSKTVTFWVYK